MKTLYIFPLFFAANVLFGVGTHVYVTDHGGETVEIIDSVSNTSQYIYGFKNPRVVKVSSDGVEAYVGQDNGAILAIDTSTHVVTKMPATVPRPVAMAITPDNQFLYVTSSDNYITVIRTSDGMIETTIPGFDDPEDIKINKEGTFAYVTDRATGKIRVIDTSSNTIVNTISIPGGSPTGFTLTNTGIYGYATDPVNNCLYKIDVTTGSVVSTLYGYNAPRYIAVGDTNLYMYVTCTGDNTVLEMRLEDDQIVTTIQVPNPRSIAVTPGGVYLYVGSAIGSVFKFRVLSSTTYEFIEALPGFGNPSNLAITVNNPPASSVNGCRILEAPGVYRNHVRWEPAAGNPVHYTIYRDASRGHRIARLSGTTYEYYENSLVDDQTYWYYLVAEYANGFSSTMGNVVVPPDRKCLNSFE